jgi:uncharacterized protein (UPF0332 family)
MTENDRQEKDYSAVLVNHWIDKARNDLESAQVNFQSGRLSNAVRDIYFACFHVVSALFMKEGKTFNKHSQVRASFHRDLIKPGRIDVLWGPFYEWVFDHRQQADYQPMVEFESDEVKAILDRAETFIGEMKKLLESR